MRRYPHEFSGGQRQRIAIARSLAVKPELLIADEAVSALDVSIQAQLLSLLEEIRRDLGLTIIFIAHQLAVISRLADRVAIMYLGRIVETGRTADVFSNPRHPYTQALLEAHPQIDGSRVRKPAVRTETPSAYSIPAGCRFHTRCPMAEEHLPRVDPPAVEVPPAAAATSPPATCCPRAGEGPGDRRLEGTEPMTRPRPHCSAPADRLPPCTSVPTPALILDLPKVRANIEEMRRRMETVPAALRPHAKIHKSPILGRMQIEAGAIGLTTATVWEATAMLEAGIADILIANQVVGPRKVAELARLASDRQSDRRSSTTPATSSGSPRPRSRPAARSGSWSSSTSACIAPGVRARRGRRSSSRELVERLPGLRLLGPFGYEGHCMLEPDREERVRKAKAANAMLIELADEFDGAGLATEIVAAGGLGTWDITGANPRITEIHAGSYIFSDAFHRNLVPGFDPALTVLATVISADGSMAVLDCGRKSIGIDRTPPELVGVAGAIRFEHGEHFIHEEHIAIELEDPPEHGSRRHAPADARATRRRRSTSTTATSWPRTGVVIDVWPVLGRYGTETTGVAP